MKEVSTSIFIAMKPDRVWRQLAAFHHYGRWNPFITAVAGAPAVGERIELTMKLVSADGTRSANQTVAATVVKVEDEHEIRWTHGSWLPGLLDFEHWYRIAPCKGGVRFHHVLQLSGLMSGTLKDDYFAMYRNGFAAMNDALAARLAAVEAERLPPAPATAGPATNDPVANDNAGDRRPPGAGARRAS